MSALRAVVEELEAMLRRVVREELERSKAAGPPPEYLTLREAAELARCEPRTVRRWAEDGRLELLGAGRRRVRRSDLLRLLEETPADRQVAADEWAEDELGRRAG